MSGPAVACLTTAASFVTTAAPGATNFTSGGWGDPQPEQVRLLPGFRVLQVGHTHSSSVTPRDFFAMFASVVGVKLAVKLDANVGIIEKERTVRIGITDGKGACRMPGWLGTIEAWLMI